MTTVSGIQPARAVHRGRTLVAAAVLGGALAVVTATLAMTAPDPALPGAPAAGPGLALVGSAARLGGRVAAVLVVGGLLLPAWLLPHAQSARRARRLVVGAAWFWVAMSIVEMLALSADALGIPLAHALTDGRTWAFVPKLATGRALEATAVLAAVVASGVQVARNAAEHLALLGVALLATVPAALSGHAAAAGLHVAVGIATVVHVLAALLWVGGLVALGLVGRGPGLPAAVTRFSRLALVATILVVGGGLLSASWRLGSGAAAWASPYGILVLVKTALLTVLLTLGALHRRRTIPALRQGSPRAWWRLAVVETGVMGLALGVAVALGRAPTPTRSDVVALPHGGVSTVDRALPPPAALELLLEPRATAPGLAVLAVATIVLGLAASRGGRPRPATLRGLGFGAAACLVLAWLLMGGPGSYGSAILLVHAAQLLGCALLVPPLVAASARAFAPHRLPRIRGGPVDTAAPIILLVLVVYGTPVLRSSLASEATHTVVLLAAVAAGLPAALRENPAERRLGGLVLLGLAGALLLVLAWQPEAFAPEWFANLPLDWADPVRGTDVGGRRSPTE
ncbi:MAG: CopD family protein [Dermatophilaceae bacterium]